MSRRVLLAALYAATAVMFTAPLALIALVSLSQSDIVGFPLGRFGLHWYEAALHDPAYRRAFLLSAWVAVASAGLASLLGCWAALAFATLRRHGLQIVLPGATLLPLATPGIVHAVALRISMQTIGLPPGATAIVLSHVIHAMPYAAILVAARRATLPEEQVSAARTLGAGTVAVFAHVVLPWIRPALAGAACLAALSSFDDFVRSFFVGGYDPTLPVLIFARLRSGLTPEINAVSTLVLLATLAAVAGFEMRRLPR